MKSSSNDRLGASLFPAPSSQQRVPDGNGGANRNKVALKPGRSLMDWIRLTHSGKDLTGVSGKLLDVTPDELAQHDKTDDAWICLKGKVYNVTAYAEFHPGGQEELMRGVGKDATDLFNEVHKWVNFESMLEKCLVGRLKPTSTFALKGRSPLERDLIKSLNRKIKADSEKALGNPNPSESKLIPSDIPKPDYDWFQTEKSVSVVVYAKSKEIRSECITLDINDRVLRFSLTVKRKSYLLHIDLEDEINPAVNVKIGKESGAIEILISKKSPRMWSGLGNNLENHDTFLPTQDREIHFRGCVLTEKVQLTRDIYLFTFQIPTGTILNVPIGHHVRLRLNVQDTIVVRSYTPVSSSLTSSDSEEQFPAQLHLAVKIYSDGVLTPELNQIPIGERVSIGDPDGTFSIEKLKNCEKLSLLAAGTGFTPMVRLIRESLLRNERRIVKLMFFNKTEADIPWREQLEHLSQKYDRRFKTNHVLSEADDDWNGLQGRINSRLLGDFLECVTTLDVANDSDSIKDPRPVIVTPQSSNHFICICGPTQFTNSTLAFLKELGYNDEQTHVFKG